MSNIETAIKTISDIYDDYLRSEIDTVNLSRYDAQLLEVHTLLENYLQEKQERDNMRCGNCFHKDSELCRAVRKTKYDIKKEKWIFKTMMEEDGFCSRFDPKENAPCHQT